MLNIFHIALISCSLALVSNVHAEDPQPTIVVADISGTPQTPFEQPDKSATVLFFVLPDCPISNATAPEIQRIISDYQPKQVSCFVVYVDPDLTVEAARKHAESYGLTGTILVDSELKLVRQAEAKIAPEAVVLGPDGKIEYQGRINNLYASIGKRRASATQHEVRDALDAVLTGSPVQTPRVPAIGCHIVGQSN